MAGRRRGADRDAAEAQALWRRVTETVAPLPGRPNPPVLAAKSIPPRPAGTIRVSTPPLDPAPSRAPGTTLDGSWDRRLANGAVAPDRTIDLHGETLDQAYALIDGGLEAAIRARERIVLLIAGKARPDARPSHRGGRGAIRAVVTDWLAASRHAGAIAAIRPAHPRHGGSGALYVILRRR